MVSVRYVKRILTLKMIWNSDTVTPEGSEPLAGGRAQRYHRKPYPEDHPTPEGNAVNDFQVAARIRSACTLCCCVALMTLGLPAAGLSLYWGLYLPCFLAFRRYRSLTAVCNCVAKASSGISDGRWNVVRITW